MGVGFRRFDRCSRWTSWWRGAFACAYVLITTVSWDVGGVGVGVVCVPSPVDHIRPLRPPRVLSAAGPSGAGTVVVDGTSWNVWPPLRQYVGGADDGFRPHAVLLCDSNVTVTQTRVAISRTAITLAVMSAPCWCCPARWYSVPGEYDDGFGCCLLIFRFIDGYTIDHLHVNATTCLATRFLLRCARVHTDTRSFPVNPNTRNPSVLKCTMLFEHGVTTVNSRWR